MNKDEIIRMARKAKVVIDGNNFGEDSLLYFAALVAAAEREACAQLARKIGDATEPDDWALDVCQDIESAIRERYGNSEGNVIARTAQDDTIEANCRQNFAAARGARIQIFVAETRIHPDDQYLQYGPISTALREMAADDSWKPGPYRVLAIAAANAFRVYFGEAHEDYPLFYLILAEALADEGM